MVAVNYNQSDRLEIFGMVPHTLNGTNAGVSYVRGGKKRPGTPGQAQYRLGSSRRVRAREHATRRGARAAACQPWTAEHGPIGQLWPTFLTIFRSASLANSYSESGQPLNKCGKRQAIDQLSTYRPVCLRVLTECALICAKSNELHLPSLDEVLRKSGGMNSTLPDTTKRSSVAAAALWRHRALHAPRISKRRAGEVMAVERFPSSGPIFKARRWLYKTLQPLDKGDFKWEFLVPFNNKTLTDVDKFIVCSASLQHLERSGG